MQGLALGHSLSVHVRKRPCFLLVTPDVPAVFIEALRCSWQIVQVPYIKEDEALRRAHWRGVFTKLHIFNESIYTEQIIKLLIF